MLRNLRSGKVLSEDPEWALTFWGRFMGLMGRSGLPEGGALVLAPCQSIHMLFMRFPLDVIFTDEEGKVVALVEGIRPWRLSSFHRSAHYAIELPVGTIAASETQVGDSIDLERS